MRVLITGGTGFVGRHLVPVLERVGHEVTLLSRRPGPPEERPRRLAWTPEERGDWFSHVSGQDAVIHLAGDPAVGERWTPEKKRRIMDSRVESTKRLVEAIGEAEAPPRVLATASGVGYYGPREPDDPITEEEPPGSDFLARVTVEWEGAAVAAETKGARVVRLRIGVVLGRGGGALEQMMLPFKLFAGGPLGSGKQVVPWVHVDDLCSAFRRALEDDAMTGPYNVAAPSAVDFAELARALGRAMGRPSWMPVPALALRARFGEGADPLLTGQRAVPRRLEELGFTFAHPTIDEALADLLGGERR